MKKSALFLIAFTVFAPAVFSAQDTSDTTVRFNGKTIYVHDSIGRMKVSVMGTVTPAITVKCTREFLPTKSRTSAST